MEAQKKLNKNRISSKWLKKHNDIMMLTFDIITLNVNLSCE